MSRRFIPLSELDTLRKAREIDATTQYLGGLIERHKTERLIRWLESRQEQAHV